MWSTTKLASLAGVSLCAILSLTGCFSTGAGFSVLDRAAEPGDVLPSDLPGYAYEGVERESSRLVGEHNGNRLYLIQATEADRVCLLIYSNSRDWLTGCGGAPEFGLGGPSGNYVIRADAPDSAPAPDGHIEIAENVFARE